MAIQRKYKIHATSTVEGKRLSANNQVFYDTREEAIQQAVKYARESGESFTIFESIAVVYPEPAPIMVETIEDGPGVKWVYNF